MQTILIRYCRQLANMTQKQLAMRLNVHDSLVSKWESGVVPTTNDTEEKLMKVFIESGIDAEVIYQVNSIISKQVKNKVG